MAIPAELHSILEVQKSSVDEFGCPVVSLAIKEPIYFTPVDYVIRTFGGVRATARAIGVPFQTVFTWRKSGLLPAWQQKRILAIARAQTLDITAEDLILGRSIHVK